MEVHCAVGGPIPNLPHFQQNKQMPRGRGQGFKVIEGTPVIVDKSETKVTGEAIAVIDMSRCAIDHICSIVYHPHGL